MDILDTTSAGPAVIRGGILRIGGYVLGVVLSVASAALLIRHLGAVDFGRYTTVVSIVTIVGGLTEAGMTNIAVREYTVLSGPDRDRVMRELLGLRLVLTVAGALAAFAFSAAAHYDGTMVAATAVAGAGLLVVITQATYGVPLQSGLRLGWVTAIELLRQVVTVALVVTFIGLGASLLPLVAVPAFAGVVVLIVTVPLVRNAIPLVPRFDWARSLRLLRLTLPYAAATAVGVIYVYVAVVLMSLISTQEETGYFSAAFRIFVVLGGIPGLLVASAFPVLARAARDDHIRLAYALQRLWEISLILGAGLALLTVLGAEPAIGIVAGEGFSPSVDVLRIQAGAVLASYLVATWGYALLSLGRYRALLMANALALGLSAVLILALAAEYGAKGAAVGTLAGETSLAAAYAFALMRPRSDLRVRLGVLPRVVLASAAGAAVLLVPGVPDPAAVAVGGFAYVLVLAVLRAIPREIGEAVRGWLPRNGG